MHHIYITLKTWEQSQSKTHPSVPTCRKADEWESTVIDSIMHSIQFTSDRQYTVSSSDRRFVACYELLKTKAQARLKSLYIGCDNMPIATATAQQIRQLFRVKVEVRSAQRTSAKFEVCVRSPKVALMAGIEKFVLTLALSINPVAVVPAVSKVVPLYPLINRPDIPVRSLVTGSDGRKLNII